MSDCCDASAYGSVFNDRDARRNAHKFRRRGLIGPIRAMVDELTERGIAGSTVLEIGAGQGTALAVMLERGATSGVAFDLSPASERVASELLAERGLLGRVAWHTGDFLASVDSTAPADLVILSKVVCCYPDMPRLVDAAAIKADRLMTMSFPRRRWMTRVVIGVINARERLRRSPFRVYLHEPGEIRSRVEAAGLTEIASGTTPTWEWHVWERD